MPKKIRKIQGTNFFRVTSWFWKKKLALSLKLDRKSLHFFSFFITPDVDAEGALLLQSFNIIDSAKSWYKP